MRVVPLSQASSGDLLCVKCVCVLSRYLRPVSRDLLYVKCGCVLSRYLRPVSRDMLYVKCACVLSRYLRPVVEICYMLNVCACCPVISGQ